MTKEEIIDELREAVGMEDWDAIKKLDRRLNPPEIPVGVLVIATIRGERHYAFVSDGGRVYVASGYYVLWENVEDLDVVGPCPQSEDEDGVR